MSSRYVWPLQDRSHWCEPVCSAVRLHQPVDGGFQEGRLRQLWQHKCQWDDAWYVVKKNLLCIPPSVTGEVYCFPRRQLIFSFGRRVIYHSKNLWEYIPKSIPSVCTTIFKGISGLHFNLKSLMLNINGFV